MFVRANIILSARFSLHSSSLSHHHPFSTNVGKIAGKDTTESNALDFFVFKSTEICCSQVFARFYALFRQKFCIFFFFKLDSFAKFVQCCFFIQLICFNLTNKSFLNLTNLRLNHSLISLHFNIPSFKLI